MKNNRNQNRIFFILLIITISSCDFFKNQHIKNDPTSFKNSIDHHEDNLYFLSENKINQLKKLIPDSILPSFPFTENEKYTSESITGLLYLHLTDKELTDSVATIVISFCNIITKEEFINLKTKEFQKNLESGELIGEHPVMHKYEKIDSIPQVIQMLFPEVVFYFIVQPSSNIRYLSAFYNGVTYNPKKDFNILLLKLNTWNQFATQKKALAFALLLNDLNCNVQQFNIVKEDVLIKQWNINYKVNIIIDNETKSYFMKYKDESVFFYGNYPNDYIVPHIPTITDYN